MSDWPDTLGDISLYLLGISPTLFASFPYQFASFSHQICFISPKKCVISPTKCCISPTNCFIYPTVRCISPCNFVSLCQFTKIWFYQVFSIFRCHSISKHLPLGWVSVWVGQWVEEKSLTNVSIVKSVENIWEFCEKLFPKPTFQICNVLNQHMRKKLWLWFCDKCGKYFITTLCWRCTQWATSTKKLRVLQENISETNFPGVTCLLVQETQDCIRCEKYFIKFTILKMHKFCHSGATKVTCLLTQKLWNMWKIFIKTNFPDV